MAHPKKKKKSTTHRPSSGCRVGSINQKHLVSGMEEAGGLVAGSVLAAAMQRMFATTNPKIVAGAQIAGGFFLKNNDSPLLRGIGYGIMSAGSISMAHSLGAIKGIEDLVSGVDNRMYIAGLGNDEYVGDIHQEYIPADSAAAMYM